MRLIVVVLMLAMQRKCQGQQQGGLQGLPGQGQVWLSNQTTPRRISSSASSPSGTRSPSMRPAVNNGAPARLAPHTLFWLVCSLPACRYSCTNDRLHTSWWT